MGDFLFGLFMIKLQIDRMTLDTIFNLSLYRLSSNVHKFEDGPPTITGCEILELAALCSYDDPFRCQDGQIIADPQAIDDPAHDDIVVLVRVYHISSVRLVAINDNNEYRIGHPYESPWLTTGDRDRIALVVSRWTERQDENFIHWYPDDTLEVRNE